jgi:hypothetical protein
VVLSPDDYRRLVRQADANFGRLLALSPFGPDDVDPIGMSLSGANRSRIRPPVTPPDATDTP